MSSVPSARDHIISTEAILTVLCSSVSKVLTAATKTPVTYSPMVQKINRTCLRPDIGCFVLFDGGFAGLVIINFSAAAAMEIYRNYMLSMGMPESELAGRHTSEEVGNTLGELMNQIVGDFISNVGQELLVSINQNQPKMLSINKELVVSLDANLDQPQSRRVAFKTAARNTFYMEMAMDKTEFIKLHDFERDVIDPDQILAETSKSSKASAASSTAADNSLLDALGL